MHPGWAHTQMLIDTNQEARIIMQMTADTTRPAPAPGASRAQKSRSRRMSSGRGGQRVDAIISPSAAAALAALLAAGYAPSATAAISRALIEAASREDGVAPPG